MTCNVFGGTLNLAQSQFVKGPHKLMMMTVLMITVHLW